MKTIHRILLLTLAITTLAACQQSGEGPSKPASSNNTKTSTN